MDIPNLTSPAQFIGKQSKDTISFGSGQPDLPPPEEAFRGISMRRDMRYGMIQGEEALREKLSREYSGSTAQNFVITNGASEALDLLFRVLPRGNLLLGKPYYYSYVPIIKAGGLNPVCTELEEGRINMEDFESKVRECKAVLINSPSNPTGRVENIKTLKEIEKITHDLGVYVISDEVYKDLIYERENYIIKGEHVITVNSFSKTYCLCGLRVGYLWSPDKSIVDNCIEMKTHTSMNTCLLAQDVALNTMDTPKSYVANQLKIWKERRDFIYKELLGLGLDLWKPEGAFYVLPKINKPREFVWRLYKQYNTISYLGEWFGAPDRVRFSYALSVNQIEEGIGRIKKCLDGMNGK
ncbi:pyridoxal phosphate-dependent aminotransferase [Candidatus Woesearchaeota archaeon]|nr:pyridoxal phosphate-dependent aminotransferase [Candidatus Woesearchaeota archaeon]